MVIYKLVFPDGSTYVGSTNNLAKRRCKHLAMFLNQTQNTRMNAAFAEWSNYEVAVIENCDDSIIACEREQHHMDLVPVDKKLNGTRRAGRSPNARTLTKEQSAKMRAARKPMSQKRRDEFVARNKLSAKEILNVDTGDVFRDCHAAAESVDGSALTIRSAALQGRPYTAYGYRWCENGKEPWPVRPKQDWSKRKKPKHTPEALQKKADLIRARVSRPVQNLSTGEIYDSCTSAGKAVGRAVSTITAAARGEQKLCAGHRWAFVEK